MDKTYSDLMDIVNRTKKINEKDGRVISRQVVKKPVVEETIVEEPEEVIEETKVETKPKSSLFAGRDAISKYMETAKAKKSTSKTTKGTKTATKSTKKSTTKTTTKSTTKKAPKKTEAKENSETKKSASINDIKAKLGSIKKKEPVKKAVPELNLNNPKDKELYDALRSTLFAGGTDISEYMEKEESETSSMLNTLSAKRKANEINQDITKEQQEYEKLFTGSFIGDIEEEVQTSEANEKEMSEQEALSKALQSMQERNDEGEEDRPQEISGQAENIETDNQPKEESDYNDAKSNRLDRDIEEMRIRDNEMNAKIAEYYKRKQEALDKYNASQEEYTETTETNYDNRQQDYEDIFSGSIMSRDEVIEANTPVEEVEPVEEEIIEEPEVVEELNEEPVEEESQSEFMSLYKNLNSGDYDDEKFVTPDSEVLDNRIRDISHDESDNIIDEVMGIESEYTEEDVEREFNKVNDDFDYAPVENNIETIEDESDTDDTSDEEVISNNETFADDEIVESHSDIFEESDDSEEDEEDIYDLSANDTELDDYILSSNIPFESSNHDDNEAIEHIPSDKHVFMDVEELPESRFDLLGKKIKDETNRDNTESIEEEKQKYYDEMARLQENLINELNNPKTEEETIADAPVEERNEEHDELISQAMDIMSDLVEKKNETEDDKANRIVDELIQDLNIDSVIENIVGDTAGEEVSEATETPIAEEVTDIQGEIETKISDETLENTNLLNKDVALNETDLEYIINSEKPREVKDDYFYLSNEDKEKQEELQSDRTETSTIRTIDVGDLNLNKNINNAVPYSQEVTRLESRKVDDMETIYTLFGAQRKKMENKTEDIKVLYIASECQPFVASGGLADVAGSLPKAIAKQGGVDIRVMLPLYGNIKQEYRDKFEYIGNFTVHLSWRQEYCGIFKYVSDNVTYYFIDNERYFKRDKLYGYYDDGERFAYFCKAIVESLPLINYFPDIIHCNDWQSALVSTYIKTGNWSDFRYYKIKNIYTIHNVEYQGVYGMENLKDLFGVDYRFKNDLEYNGDINLTKAAIQYSDKFTTVSDSYCDNLKQPYCSKGLNHIIVRNEYKLSGIINGLDYDFYNPATDIQLYKNYDINSIEDKVTNKKLWQDELGLPVDGRTPMMAIVSRLVSHKGIDLLSKVMENVLQKDVQLVVVGTGDQRFIDYFKYLENKYPTKVRAMVDKFSIELGRKAYGASDIFLMPSKVEPCGISQMIASRYGSIPVVRETGGLKDTIKDFGCENGGNGYTFASYNPDDLLDRINQALRDFENQTEWQNKMKICMSQDFGWDKSATKYIDLYKSLIN